MLASNIKFDIDYSEFRENIYEIEDEMLEIAERLGIEVDFEDDDSLDDFCDYLLGDGIDELYKFYDLPTEVEVLEFCIMNSEEDTIESVSNWLSETYGLCVLDFDLEEDE